MSNKKFLRDSFIGLLRAGQPSYLIDKRTDKILSSSDCSGVGTGLIHGDIESLRVSDIDFENNYVTTRSKKTWKSMGSRPVPVPIIDELKKYVSGLGPEQEKIFDDRFSQNRWEKICQKIGLADLKFHDLRKTFGSVLSQNGVSTAVKQRLLEHSSPDLTNKVYTNGDPVLRHAVDLVCAGSIR